MMFDSFNPLNSVQPPYSPAGSNEYHTYAGNVPQYLPDGGSYGSGWNSTNTAPLATFPPTSHPRNNSSRVLRGVPSPVYTNQVGYTSYTDSSSAYPFSSSRRSHQGYQNSEQRATLEPRNHNNGDTVYSMLAQSATTGLSNHSFSPAESFGNDRNMSWGNSGSPANGEVLSEILAWSPQSADNQYFTFDSSWSDSLSSPMSSPNPQSHLPSAEYYAVETPTVNPQPRSTDTSYTSRHDSPTSSTSTSPSASRRGSVEIHSAGTGKVCSHCHATSTPLWRREPNTLRPLCNACGLYLVQRKQHRPQELIDADAADDSDESDNDGSGPECSHCHTHHTSVWRRSKTGAQLCNACGVYSRLRGRDRPLSLKRSRIKPRSKHTSTNSITSQATTPRNL